MTNENHADDLQVAESFADLLESGGEEGEQPNPADATSEADAGDDQATNDGDGKETPSAKPEPQKLGGDDALKKARDTLSRVRNDQVQLYRIVKGLEDDGVYSREEIAQKSGLALGEVSRLLDHKPTAAPGEPEYTQVLYNAFEQDVKNPVVFNALTRAYGNKDTLEELKQAYIWAHRVDPAVQDALENISPEEMTVHVFDTGREYLEEFREAQAEGGLSPLQLLRKAKALQSPKPTQKESGEVVSNTRTRHPKNAEQPMPTLAERTPQKVSVSPQEEWVRRLSS